MKKLLIIAIVLLVLTSCSGKIQVHKDGLYHVNAKISNGGVHMEVKRGIIFRSYVETAYYKPRYMSDSAKLEYVKRNGIYIIERDRKLRKQY